MPKPVFLRKFDAADISGAFLVDRDSDREWLREGFGSYFEAGMQLALGDDEGLALCLLGEKGVGKSTLAEQLITDLKARPWAVDTLFLKADCRNCQDVRRVLQELTVKAQDQLQLLEEFRKAMLAAPHGARYRNGLTDLLERRGRTAEAEALRREEDET